MIHAQPCTLSPDQHTCLPHLETQIVRIIAFA